MKSSHTFPWILRCLALWLAVHTVRADEASQAEYEKRLEKADVTANPQNHKALADWCKRRHPEKYPFHLVAAGEYEFGQLEKSLPANPGAMDLLKLRDAARRLDLPEKARSWHGRWGEKQFAQFATRLQPGKLDMMKQLLDWSIKEKVEFIPPVQELAGKIVAVEPEHLPARKVLQHLKLDQGWKSREEAMASIDLLDPAQRVKLHQAISAGSPPRLPADYPNDPTKGMSPQREGCFLTSTRQSAGAASYYVWAKNYKKSEPCPLVIDLHGGGSGGREAAMTSAGIGVRSWINSPETGKGPWVVLVPVARNHVANSWWDKENVMDLFDMLEETVERFNIDRKRIYMTGTSMGGGGTAEWVWALPETAAAYCPRAGYYWRNPPVGPRCIALGKPVMVIHGEKDEPKRNVGRDYYLKETESRGAVMSHISYPDRDHFLTPEEVFPHMIPFFRKHSNSIEPDLRLLRAAALRRLQGQRPSAGAIDDSAKADAPPPEPVIPPAK